MESPRQFRHQLDMQHGRKSPVSAMAHVYPATVLPATVRALIFLAVSSSDESIDRAVEATGQLFRLGVQDTLEPEAIDQGDDLVDQPVQVDVGWPLPVALRRGGCPPPPRRSPLPVTLVLLRLQPGAGRGAAPERQPDPPFQDPFLVEGQGLGENSAERRQP